MRVIHILNTGSFSGAENVVINIINGTRKDVDSIYVSLDGPIRDVLNDNGIEFYAIDSLNIKNIRRAVKKLSPDIIHAHDFTAGIISSLCVSNIPIINHLHNNPPWIKKLCVKSVAYAVSSIKYKKILTVSDSVMNEYIFGKMLKVKTCVVGNPINLGIIREKASSDIFEGTYDIAFLGRLTEQKNPLMFVDIIGDLIKKQKNITAVMIGDGDMRIHVEQRINELNLRDNITVLGFQNNPYCVLKNCRVLCMPSFWEGFGLAAVEALALGKPVFASAVGGLVNLINDSCGELCANTREFSDSIFSVLSEKTLYDKKSNGALVRAAELDNITQYCDRIVQIYCSVSKN